VTLRRKKEEEWQSERGGFVTYSSPHIRLTRNEIEGQPRKLQSMQNAQISDKQRQLRVPARRPDFAIGGNGKETMYLLPYLSSKLMIMLFSEVVLVLLTMYMWKIID